MWNKFKKMTGRGKAGQRKSNGHVLIVEEGLSCREFLCQALQREHYSPVVVEKGSVMETAASVGPCLIILNSIISGKKTLDLCAKLKAAEKMRHIPVLIIAEKNDASDIVEYFSQNVDCFLTKPFTKKELISQVKMFAL